MGKKLSREQFENLVTQDTGGDPIQLNKAQQKKMSAQELQFLASTMQEGSPNPGMESRPETQYYKGYLQAEGDFEKHLANNQPWWDEAGNAGVRFALNTIPGIIGNTAAALDIEDYFNKDNEIGNGITRWAENLKNEVNQNIAPIYRKNNGINRKPLDLGDSAWWFENGAMLAESATEFALLGYGLGAAMTKASQAAKWVGNLASADVGMVAGKATEIGGVFANATMLNQAESILSATQIYDQVYKEGLSAGLSDEDAKLKASAAGSHVVNTNRMNILLNLSSAAALMKGAKYTRQLVKEKGVLKPVFFEGAQEYAEETVNLYSENVGKLYGQHLVAGGTDEDFEGRTLKNFANTVMSLEGLEAGILGFAGGAIQTAATTGLMKDQRRQIKEKAALQQTEIKKFDELRKAGKLSNIYDTGESLQQHAVLLNERNKIIGKLNQPGPVDPADLAKLKRVDRDLLSLQAFDHFNLGTTELLERQYQDITSLTQEQAAKQGFTGDQLNEKSPVYYKTRAEEIIKTLKGYEDIYNKYALGYLNSKELFGIKAQEQDLKEDRQILVKQIQEQKNIAQESLNAIERPGLLWGISGGLQVDELNKRDYAESQVGNINDERQITARKELIKTAKESEAYLRFQELTKLLEDHDKTISKLSQLYAERASQKNQEKLRSDVKRAEELIKQAQANEALELKKQEQAQAKVDKAIRQEEVAKVDIKPNPESAGINIQNTPAQPAAINTLEILQAAVIKLNDSNKPPLTVQEANAVKDPNYRELFEDLMNKQREAVRQAESGAVAGQSGNPITSNTGDPTNYSALTDKDITNLIKVVEVENESQWENLSREKRLTQAHNVLAYLARNYEQVLYVAPDGVRSQTGLADVNDQLNEDLQDPRILDSKYLNVGDKITLKHESDYGGFVNYEGKRVKWSDIQRDLQGQAYLDHTPVSVRKNGVIIGYLHTPNWITEDKIQTSVEEDRAQLRKIREYAIMHGEATSTITKRMNGKLIVAKDRVSDSVANAFKGKPQLRVMYNGNLVNSRNYNSDPSTIVLNQNRLSEGVTYLVLPVNYNPAEKKNLAIAVPVRHSKLADVEITSLSTAARIYMKVATGMPLTEADQGVVKAVQEVNKSVKINGQPGNFDISTYQGAKNYFQLFAYSHNKDTTTNQTLKAYLADQGSAVTALEVTPNGIDFGKGGGQDVVVGQFDFAKDATDYLKKLEDHLRETYHNVSLDFLQSAVKVPLISTDNKVTTTTPVYEDYLRDNVLNTIFRDVNAGSEAQPNYVNSIQAIIEFDKDFLNADKPGIQPEYQHSQAPANLDVSQSAIYANDLYETLKTFMTELSAGAPVGSVLGDINVVFNKLQDVLKTNPNALKPDKKAKLSNVQAFISSYNNVPSKPTSRSDIKFPEVPSRGQGGIAIDLENPESIKAAHREIQGKVGDLDIKINTQTNDYLDSDIHTTDNLPGASLTDEQYKAMGFKFKIPGLSFKAQNSLVKFVAADINRKFVAGSVKDKQQTIEQLLKPYKTGINKIYVDSVNSNAPHKGFELILKHWEVIENMTGYLLQSLYNFNINKDALGELVSEEEASLLVYGQNALEKDPKNTLSARFKRFLSDVENPLEKNFLGRGEIMHYAEVYNHMSAILAGTEPVFNKMLDVLNKHANTYPWVNQVMDKLVKADSQIKNEFVVSFSKHYVNTKFAMFGKTKNGEADARILDDNSSSRIQVIKANWKNNLLSASLVDKNFDTGAYTFNPARVRGYIEDFDKITKENVKNFDIRSWLGKLGIEVHPQMIEELKTQGYRPHPKAPFTNEYFSLFTNQKGLFKQLYNILKNIEKDPAGDVRESKLLSDNVITRLAALNEQYDTQTLTQSHRSGDRIIYSYTDNKFVVSRVQELQSNVDLLNKLVTLPFSKHSYWLQQMLEYDHQTQQYLRDGSGNVIMKANAAAENFDISYLGLQVLKEKGALAPNKYTLEDLTSGEHEKAKLAFYFNKGLTSQGINLHQFFDLTLSNKGTMVSLTAPGISVKMDTVGDPDATTVDQLFDYTVLPEIARMLNYKSGHDINGYDKGANIFYFYPALNQIEELFNTDGTLVRDILQKPELIDKIKNSVKQYIKAETEYKIQLWKDAGIVQYDVEGNLQFTYLDANYVKRLAGLTSNASKGNLLRLAAMDMSVNYTLANVNIFQLISTDPANYFKSTAQDKFQQALDTFDNIGKRLGGEISPGKDLALTDNENELYTVGVVNDAALDSLGISEITKLFEKEPALAEKYKNIKATDAQEFTTVAEHIKVLYKSGKLTEEQWTKLSGKVASNNFEEFSPEELGLILQPMKPIQVGSKIDLTNNVERRFYIKSSSFPLIPQLVKGHELEKVLALMDKQKIDRLVFQSAFKVGSVAKPASLFNKEGRVTDNVVIPTLELQRKYFRVQQEVPVKTSGEILRVSQASKLAFINLLDKEKYEKLNEKYLAAYNELYKISLEELAQELGFDITSENWEIDPQKLKVLIDREISSRTYPIQDLEALEINPETGEFNIPIWALNYSDRLESFLMSIVKNRVIKQYMTGSSFVLGTEVGFKAFAPEQADKKKMSLEEFKEQRPELASKIVYTDEFSGELRPATSGTGYFHEILVPWKFKDLRMEDYLTAEGTLDSDKFDKDILKMFGMRIPNQGPNSTAAMKIVGFLREEVGDLMIAPRDFVTQMGSDFDIDKVYAYMYSYFINEKGKVKKLTATDPELDGYIQDKATNKLKSLLKNLLNAGFEEEAGKEFLITKGVETYTLNEIVNFIQKKLHQNTILDVHLAINTDPDPEIQRSIKRPLEYGELDMLAVEINKLSPSPITKTLSPISSSYQQMKYTNAASSSNSIGAFAVANTFNALVQNKEVELVVRDDEDRTVGMTVKFGSEVFDGNLSTKEAADGFKSDNISAFLSAAVDDEVQQILNKINVNDITIPLVTFLLQAGFSQKTIVYFINQEIIRDYVKEYKRISERASGFTANPQQAAINRVLQMSKYSIPDAETFFESEQFARYQNIGKSELKELLRGDVEGVADYKKKQLALLSKLDNLMNNQVKLVRHIQSAVNVDVNGPGASLFESIIKQQDIESLPGLENVLNADTLIGDFIPVTANMDPEELKAAGYIKGDYYWIKPTTIAGFAGVYGIVANNKIWNNPKYFPYSLPGVKNALSEVVSFRNLQGTSAASRADKLHQAFRQLKHFMYTNSSGVQDLNPDRSQLLYDSKNNVSLATIYERVWQTEAIQSNKFLKLLSVRNPSDNTEPKILTVKNPFGDVFGDFEIYTSIVDALSRPKDLGNFNGIQYDTRLFIEHLFRTGFISSRFGPALEVLKYVPVKWLQAAGMADYFRNFDFGKLVNRTHHDLSVNNFTRQYFQHNPRQAPQVDIDIAENKLNAVLAPVYKKGKLVSYTITDKTLAGNIPATKFVAFKDTSSPIGYALFEKVSENNHYVRINTLGTQMHLEYNFNQDYSASIVSDNNTDTNPVLIINSPQQQTEPVMEPEEEQPVTTPTAGTTIVDVSRESFLAQYGFDPNSVRRVFTSDETHKMLKDLAKTSNNTGFKAALEFIESKIDSIPGYVFQQDTMLPAIGNTRIEATVDSNNKILESAAIISVNPKLTPTHEGLEQTVIHENIHALTKLAIAAPTNDRQRRAKKRLENLLEEYKKVYNVNPTNNVPGTGMQDQVTMDYLNLVYPAMNIEEFLSGIWTSPELRERLQTLPYGDPVQDKTFWDEVLDILRILFKSFNLDPESTAGKAILDSLTFMVDPATGIFTAREGVIVDRKVDQKSGNILARQDTVLPVDDQREGINENLKSRLIAAKKLYKDTNGQWVVKQNSGEPSQLFADLKAILGDQDRALNEYLRIKDDNGSFKKKFGDWENRIMKDYGMAGFEYDIRIGNAEDAKGRFSYTTKTGDKLLIKFNPDKVRREADFAAVKEEYRMQGVVPFHSEEYAKKYNSTINKLRDLKLHLIHISLIQDQRQTTLDDFMRSLNEIERLNKIELAKDYFGEPQLFMHGGSAGITRFKVPGEGGYVANDIMTGSAGIYFTRSVPGVKYYSEFGKDQTGKPGSGKDVYYAFLKTKNPYYVTDPRAKQDYKLESSESISKADYAQLSQKGYDSVIWDDGSVAKKEMIVFQPDQIETIGSYNTGIKNPIVSVPQDPDRQDPAAVNKPVQWQPSLNYEGNFRPKNVEQEEAIVAIREFIKDGNSKEWFTLEGKAGTGKTTLVQEAIRPFLDRNIAVAALAHKAKRVLSDKLRANGIDVEGYSMAALLGMELDLETGEFKPKKFSRSDEGRAPIEYLDVIIVDECSMINEENLDLLMKLKKPKAKVIFLGDIGQLDPIRKQNVDKPSPTFETKNKAKLLTRVRQGEESPILPYADFYWNNSVLSGNPVKDPVDPMGRNNKITDKGNLVFEKDLQSVLNSTIRAFKEGLDAGNPDRIRIVCFRNETRATANKMVREGLYKSQYMDGAIPEYVPGDILIMMDNFEIDEDTRLENSTEFIVKAAKLIEDTIPDATGGRVKLPIYEVTVQVDGETHNIQVPTSSARPLFDKIVAAYFDAAKKLPAGPSRGRAYAGAWAMKNRYPRLDYAYALTSHKSQGSTFETVVVDETDIMSVGPTSNANKSKSMYTAITRASKTAVVLSKTNPKQDPTKTTTITSESLLMGPAAAPSMSAQQTGRFMQLVDERQAVLNSYNKRLSEINLELANTQDAQERVTLLKRKTKIEDKIDRAYQDLTDVKSAVQVEDLKIFAENDLDEISALIVLGNSLSFAEIDVLSQKLKLWSNAVDNLYTESEKKSAQLKSVFRIGKPGDKYPLGIENTAKDLQIQLDQVKVDKIVNLTQDITNNKNLTQDALFKAVTDVSKLASETLDLSKAPLAILQTIAEYTKQVQTYAKEELIDLGKQLQELTSKAYGAAYKYNQDGLEGLFIEKDSEGNRTGNLVLPYAPEYLSTKYKLYNAAKEADKRGDSKAWKAYFDFINDNEIEFDIRRLIKIPGYENFYDLEQQDNKHKTELVNILGQSEYDRRLSRVETLWKRYQTIHDAQQIMMAEDPNLTPDQQKKALEEWEEMNSPAKYLDKKNNKHKSVNYGYRYLESIPLKTSRSGKSTKWYSEQFEIIKNDPDLFALHQFMVKTLVDLRKYLPQDLQDEFRINTLPAMQKSVMEIFRNQGIAAGMVSMLDATKETMSSLDTGNIVYSDAQTQGRYLSPRVTSLNDKIKQRYEEKLKDFKRGGSVITEPERMQLYAEASNEIARENTFDIPRLIGAYASVVLSYKHKSRIEDAIRIAEEVFNTKAKEIKTNALGEPIFRNMAGSLVGVETTDGLKNYKEMLKYHLDKFFGVPQKIEGKTEGKLYTDRENKRKKKLEDQLKKVNADVDAITAELQAAEADTTLDTVTQTVKVGQLKAKLTAELSTKQSLEGDIALLGRAVTGTGISELIHRYVYLKGLGWNMFSAFTNVGFGVISNLIEASGSQFYTQGQMMKAYRLTLHSVGKNYTFNQFETDTAKKIRTLMDQWDVLKKSSEELFRNKTLVTGKAAFLNAYNMQNRSEYVNQAPVMIAVMMNTKIKTKAGEKNLWEIYGQDGVWDADTYGELDVVFPKVERARFKSRLDKIIRNNHGNYDPAAPLKIKENILGRALSVFRTWMFEGFANRFEKEYQDEILGLERKGRYRSYGGGSLVLAGASLGTVILPGIGSGIGAAAGFVAGKFLPNKERRLEEYKNMSDFEELFFTTKQLLRKMVGKSTKFDERFTATDAANLRRNLTEINLLLALTAVFMLLKHMLEGEDDEDSKYSLNTLINLSTRLQQDIGFYADPISFMHIIKNPLPATQVVTDSEKFVIAVSKAMMGEDEIPTGSYAGESRTGRAASELIPLWAQFKTMQDIGTQQFFGK